MNRDLQCQEALKGNAGRIYPPTAVAQAQEDDYTYGREDEDRDEGGHEGGQGGAVLASR